MRCRALHHLFHHCAAEVDLCHHAVCTVSVDAAHDHFAPHARRRLYAGILQYVGIAIETKSHHHDPDMIAGVCAFVPLGSTATMMR